MKYLCLVYIEEKILNALPKAERQSLSDESRAFCNDVHKNGQLIAASPLHPVETATTVRVRSGKTATTDGPFAETKEQLGGFLAIDVRDLNDAIRIAAQFPAAGIGSIEVRPMKELAVDQTRCGKKLLGSSGCPFSAAKRLFRQAVG